MSVAGSPLQPSPAFKHLHDRLEAMPLEAARTAIRTLALGNEIGSDNHNYCLSWLAGKDEKLNSARAASTSRWARHAAYAAYAAAIIAAISMAITIFK